ncbi:helix-turn-helix domain-containing protein [Streptomyces sp. NPDC058746]|uniref:helix-turn-helix domain-containing protein n=1 Tax=Streptomyces sp. NPDC058746 TaxID=3346622 RepID=UPI0036AD05DD
MTQSVETTSASDAERSLPSPKERRRLREAAELTHDEVAAVVGVTPTTVRSWETGRTAPRGRKLEAYARFLTRLQTPAADMPGTDAESFGALASDVCASPGAVRLFTGTGPLPEPTAEQAAEPPADPEPAPPAAAPAAAAPPGSAGSSAPPAAGDAPGAAAPGPAAEHTTVPEPDHPPAPADTPSPGPARLGAAAPGPQSGGSAEPLPAEARPAAAEASGSHGPAETPRPTSAGTGQQADGLPAEQQAGQPAEQPEEQPEEPSARLPVEDFDALHAHAAPALTRQAYLLTGRRGLALEAVDRAFQLAWDRWPEVATDPDPVGWVRAAVHEYALSPWHQFRRAHRHPDKPPAEPADRILLDAMLALPTNHRRTVLLYDGVGLDLPDTAAETEASTPTAGNRLLHAHATLASRIPELAAVAPEKQSALLRDRFTALQPAVALEPRPAAAVRNSSERRARLRTRAVVSLAAVIAVATAYTTATAPTKYEPPNAPGANVSGVPPHSGPQQLTEESKALHDKLRSDPAAGPARIAPKVE